ncbi:MAG: GerMN domain-containing protein [Oscillospiraceae bacterium]|jgi:hypothetical protein|nr:GerMN domain-containing protein [Oscillospiraceae bacterium]
MKTIFHNSINNNIFNNITKRRAAAVLICMIPLFAGSCVDLALKERTDVRELPTVRPAPSAPIGDSQASETAQVSLYLPDQERVRLTAQVETIETRAGESLAEAAVNRLLSLITPLFPNLGGQALRLSSTVPAIERTCDMAIVNLGVSMRLLTPREQFAVRAAIVNTLTGVEGLSTVGVLVNGREDGVDLASTIPYGLLRRFTAGDIDTPWKQAESQSFDEADSTKIAALYYPALDEPRLIPEPRAIIVAAADTAQEYQNALIETLMAELAKNSAVRPAITRSILPPAELNYIVAAPRAYTPGGSADHLLQLSFRSELDDYLAVNGGDRASLFASLTYTLTGFVPGLDGLVVHIGGALVTEVTSRDGQVIHFENGRMSRSDFPNYAANIVTIYFPLEGGGLAGVERSVEQRLSSHPRTLLRMLLEGPVSWDPHDGLLNIVQSNRLTEADILGVSIADGAALVNVSQAFADSCAELTAEQTHSLIYSIVNTLTELRGVKRVRFYTQGEAREFFNEPYSSLGEYLRNPGIIIE